MAGFRTWTPLEVITASNVQEYLQNQTVLYFDNASARSSAVTTPTEGMHSYLDDVELVEVYSDGSWVSANSVGGTVAGSQVVGAITSATINATNVVNTLTNSTATAFTFASANQSQTVRFTSASNVTATISTATSFTPGQRVDLLQDGAGTVTVVPGAGVTIAGRGTAGTAYALTQYDGATIFCVDTNTYRIIGNVTVA